MTPGLNQRRRAEINAKVSSLDAEMLHWKQLTEQPGLRRHYTQVRRVAAVLEGLTESVKAAITTLPADATSVLDNAMMLENDILAAHSIWEVFRAKLVLREDDMFRNILAACDDLAWECYGPAMKRFAPDRKGPPLVYFTATWSPFMAPRDSSFHNEVRAGPGAAGALRDEAFLQVLKRLPVPLVSIPWYHAFYLPGALVIAHEIGHVVESDFDLTADIEAALSRAGLENDDSWKSWASEVFADLYGCLCMGPAFVGAMMDLLSTSVSAVQTETRSSGKYPTRALRVELMLEALKAAHEADAIRLRMTWEDAYGPMQTMLGFKADIAKVVKAIHAGPYKGGALTDIIGFPNNAGQAVRTIGEAAAAGLGNILANYTDPRQLFAGAQWLHENPQAGPQQDPYKLIVDQIVAKGGRQVRRRGSLSPAPVTVEPDPAASQDIDRQSGRELRALLSPGA